MNLMKQKSYIIFILILFIISACTKNEIKEERTTCNQDSECIPCGDSCISAKLAPYVECNAPTHNNCKCINKGCVKA